MPNIDESGYKYDVFEINILINKFKVLFDVYYLMEIFQGDWQYLFVVWLRLLWLHRAPIIILWILDKIVRRINSRNYLWQISLILISFHFTKILPATFPPCPYIDLSHVEALLSILLHKPFHPAILIFHIPILHHFYNFLRIFFHQAREIFLTHSFYYHAIILRKSSC